MKSNELARLLSRAESHLKAGRLKHAKSAYLQILSNHPRSTEAHFQIAVLLHDEDDLEGAVRHFKRLLDISPKLAEVHFNLGTMLVRLGRKQEATESFMRAVELQPSMAEAHNNLGIVLRDHGDIEGAIECFESATRHAPRFVSALLNLGTTLLKLHRPDRAVEVCRLARELQPELAETHLALGLSLEQAGQIEEARQCLQEAVRRKPESSEWQFHFAASKGLDGPTIAPAEYVASLFDAYAARFDEHLRGSLNYRTPEHILNAVCALAPGRRFEILDLGCGTGLCGELFRPFANRLVGIDLSSEMIKAATRRKIYDELEVNDIVGILQNRVVEFDLILAADVFVYVGDLRETFLLTYAALKPNGLFAFSVESAEEGPQSDTRIDGYHLNPSRRFSHTLGYVRQLSARQGFSELSAELATLRTQAGDDVLGWIVVLAKSEKPDAVQVGV